MPDAVLGIYAAAYGPMADKAQQCKQVDESAASPAQTTPFAAAQQARPADGEALDDDVVPQLRSVKSILKTSSSDLSESAGSASVKRAVSWHDFEGKHLHTVREYTPA